jgi:transcriptional regulator with XRE-family HTH domain
MTGKQLPSGPTSLTVRANIALLRSERGLTYAELSRELERRGHPIPPLGLRRIEAGERRVDVDDLMALALSLGVNPHALLLPPLKGSDTPGAVTGAVGTGLNSRQVWDWAVGLRPLTSLDGSTSAFRDRVRPVEVLTDDERASRRRTWLVADRLKRQEDLERGGLSGAEDPEERGEEPDPRDDEAWALEDFDPAPPLTFDLPDA